MPLDALAYDDVHSSGRPEFLDLRREVMDAFKLRPIQGRHYQFADVGSGGVTSPGYNKQSGSLTDVALKADIGDLAARLRDLKPAAVPKFIPLNEWEGVVSKVDHEAGIFVAKLRDRTDPKSPRERADFDIGDVVPDDLPLLREGAVFRWLIGKRESVFGGQERTSRLVFRRLPIYRQGEIDRAEAKADEIMNRITIE